MINIEKNTNTNEINTLSDVPIGTACKVINLICDGAIRRRFLDLGIIKDTEITALSQSPSGDPVAYFIRGAVIAIRSEDAETIEVQIV